MQLGNAASPPGLPPVSHSSDLRRSKGVALLVIMLLPVPFAAFLWWLTLGRIARPLFSKVRGAVLE